MSTQSFFDLFNAEASSAVLKATEYARKYKHSHISPEHLLLGILESAGEETQKVIRRGRATSQQMIELVKHHLRIGELEIPDGQLNFSERGKRVIEAARQECTRTQSEKVEPKHILFGLSKVPNTVAAAVLGAVDLKEDELFH